MIAITIEKFTKLYVQNNKGEKQKDVVKRLKDALNRKRSGAKCQQCGQPIWSIESAVGNFDGCFTCITGESDDPDYYEIY